MPNKINETYRQSQQWINTKIQRKMLIWTIGFWIISLCVLGVSIFWIGQNVIINETRQRNVQLASVVSRDVNSQISSILADIRVFSNHLETAGSDLESQAAALMALRLSSPQRFSAIYYFDSAGNSQLYLNDPLETLIALKNTDIASRPQISIDKEIMDTFNMTKGINTYVSEVRFIGLDEIPVMYIGQPVTLSDGSARVVVFEVDLRDIWQRIDLSTTGDTGFTYAVSRNGTIIAYPQPASIGRQIPAEITPLLQGFEGITEYNEPSNNRNVIAAYSPVGGPTGWGIVVVQDKTEANIPVIRTGLFIISILLGLALLGTIGILILARNFTKPIVNLTQTTHTIAQTGDLTRLSNIKRPDEVGQLSQAFDQMIERLQTSESRLANAAMEERNRLARDLHDAVSQTLFSASIIAEVLPRLWEKNHAEGLRRLEEVRQLTRGALAEMRTLLLELRPAALAEAEIGHLLHQLGESITGRSRIPVTVNIEGECSPPVEVKIALYRIAQEALNNVAKHSGAQEAHVSLVCQPSQMTLTVTDNGHGFDVANNSTKSLGMGIIRERAKEIGATLSIQSQKDKGTEIKVDWIARN